jgi:DNA-binding transcriptional LysR family regulator
LQNLPVTLDELRWFLVMAQLQNVSRAARELNLSQPALSRAIRRIERRYGVELFDRSRQRLTLNRFGSVVRGRMEAALRELSLVEDDIAALQEPRPGVVSLAFLHSFGTWLVPDLLGRFATVQPATQFVLHQDSADEVRARLNGGRADLVLTSPRPAEAVIGWTPLQDERLTLAVPTAHRLARRSELTLAEVIDEGFIAMHTEFGLRQTTDAMFARRGTQPRIVLESAEIATIKALVGSGLGVAITPGGEHAPAASGVVSIPLSDDDAYRTIGLAWRLDRSLPATACRFRSFVISTASPTGVHAGSA